VIPAADLLGDAERLVRRVVERCSEDLVVLAIERPAAGERPAQLAQVAIRGLGAR
jgi:hypothetical protein